MRRILKERLRRHSWQGVLGGRVHMARYVQRDRFCLCSHRKSISMCGIWGSRRARPASGFLKREYRSRGAWRAVSACLRLLHRPGLRSEMSQRDKVSLLSAHRGCRECCSRCISPVFAAASHCSKHAGFGHGRPGPIKCKRPSPCQKRIACSVSLGGEGRGSRTQTRGRGRPSWRLRHNAPRSFFSGSRASFRSATRPRGKGKTATRLRSSRMRCSAKRCIADPGPMASRVGPVSAPHHCVLRCAQVTGLDDFRYVGDGGWFHRRRVGSADR
jgi:hypothetical protein